MTGTDSFAARVAGRLASLPGVRAVALGGSRATGEARPDSDWDFAIYYRGRFAPDDLRAIGWEGQVFDIGAWGGGVFNGGAWLTVEGRRVDVHYRDLDDVERRIAEAERGEFAIEHLLFHLVGIPTYVVVAELAVNQVVRGDLPKPDYPGPLRASASRRWWTDAQLTLGYARTAHARSDRRAEAVGSIVVAALQTAHAILAARGEWVTNEKGLLDRAGLRAIEPVVGRASAGREPLVGLVDEAEATLRTAAARVGVPAEP
jgi:hypothetical protein